MSLYVGYYKSLESNYQNMKNNRRAFLKQSATLSMSLLLSNKLFALSESTVAKAAGKSKATSSSANILRGFIVSDAHFGWENAQQPNPQKQKMMINAIRRKFPKLDVFLDTGDAHHNGDDRDKDRGDWSDIIMYQDEPAPFFYVPGNHEITHPKFFDVEMTSGKLGSHELRPYYSFDLKGVHFVSVPELIRAVYVPKELLDWLKLDLELNKNRTTILLSHNSLIGYSKNFEEGYRGVVNSQEIIDLISQYPNCIAWMYGHNHNYEVVDKLNKLFISNGRIGGFDPSKGKHGLGGIYFEVTNDKVDIRCYSAEFDKFVDEFDDSELYRGTLNIDTTFDAAAPACYSVGVGRARKGEIVPLFHHHISSGKPMDLVIAGVDGTIINEDPEFKYFMRRMPANDLQLMGSSVTSGKTSYEWKNPGVLMLATGKNATMTLPRSSHNKYTYYRVAAGHEYKVTLDVQGNDGGGQQLTIVMRLHDRSGNEVRAISSNRFTLTGNRQTLTHLANFPEEKQYVSIYTDEKSDNVFNLSVEIVFEAVVKPVMVHQVALEFANAGMITKNPSVKINEQLLAVNKDLYPNQQEKFAVNAREGNRSVIKVETEGNGMLTWLLKISDLQWQVLGAQCEDRPTSIMVGPMRNLFSHKKEVVINPFFDFTGKTFVYRMRNVNKAEIFPLEKGNEKIKVKVIETLSTQGEIEVYSDNCDLKVTGAVSWAQNGNKYIISVKAGSEITIA